MRQHFEEVVGSKDEVGCPKRLTVLASTIKRSNGY